jgi:AAA+ ATPase superfamily predicted ATPase
MMETEVIGYKAPLYGRRTGSILLNPLELPTIPLFFPNYTPIQHIEAWAVLGGMPYYLSAFSDQVDIFANIREQVLDVQGLLYTEPRLLLLEELREPRNYFSILRAIAQGSTRLNEIAQKAGVGDSPVTARYLDILQQMRLVYRSVPATESQPEKSKKGIYHIVGRDKMNKYQWAVRVAQHFNLDDKLIVPILSKDLKQKALRPQKNDLNTTKAQKELNTKLLSLKEALILITKLKNNKYEKIIKTKKN